MAKTTQSGGVLLLNQLKESIIMKTLEVLFVLFLDELDHFICEHMVFFHLQVDLRHRDEVKDSSVVDIGIDLSEFYQSVEWDILEVPAERSVHGLISYRY